LNEESSGETSGRLADDILEDVHKKTCPKID
jgi:hypothetical protein